MDRRSKSRKPCARLTGESGNDMDDLHQDVLLPPGVSTRTRSKKRGVEDAKDSSGATTSATSVQKQQQLNDSGGSHATDEKVQWSQSSAVAARSLNTDNHSWESPARKRIVRAEFPHGSLVHDIICVDWVDDLTVGSEPSLALSANAKHDAVTHSDRFELRNESQHDKHLDCADGDDVTDVMIRQDTLAHNKDTPVDVAPASPVAEQHDVVTMNVPTATHHHANVIAAGSDNAANTQTDTIHVESTRQLDDVSSKDPVPLLLDVATCAVDVDGSGADGSLEPLATDCAIPSESESPEPIKSGPVASTTNMTAHDSEPPLTRVDDVQHYCLQKTDPASSTKEKSLVSSVAENTPEDVDSRGVQLAADDNVVYCGRNYSNYPGNCNFQRRVTESFESWLLKSKAAQEEFYDQMLAEFVFVNGWVGPNFGKRMDEKWCRKKIRDLLNENRRRIEASQTQTGAVPTDNSSPMEAFQPLTGAAKPQHRWPVRDRTLKNAPIQAPYCHSPRALKPGAKTRGRKARKPCALVHDESSDDGNSFSEEPFSTAIAPYVEELGYHRFAHAQTNSRRHLKKIGPLPEPALPDLPQNTDVRWTWGDGDSSSRILYADLRGLTSISIESQRFYAKMLDRDDFALITLGMVEGMDMEAVKRFMQSAFPCNRRYNLFRHYRRETNNQNGSDEVDQPFLEQNGSLRMVVHDFLNFLDANAAGGSQSTETFLAYDGDDNEVPMVPGVDLLYMFDVDCPKLVHSLDDLYKRQYKMKEAFPRGGWCMMSHVPAEYCPFMGPNCYVTNGGSSTGLHQDGYGTVDSGHTVIAGYNEVVMLRRLPEIHKVKACMMMPGLENAGPLCAEAILYGYPHDDCEEGVPRTQWPTHDTIAKFKEMGYCPKVFIAEEGSHIHIPKGCLHIFRKMRVDPLPKEDCHCKLRAALVRKLRLKVTENPICFSLAFDWMYMGSDAIGINRQVASIIECAGLCRKEGRESRSLAIPEVCVLKLAAMIAAHRDDTSDCMVEDWNNYCVRPTLKEFAAGILPSLRYIVERDTSVVNGTGMTAVEPDEENPKWSLDPNGYEYCCMVCDQELSNTYFHCDGCAKIRFKDFIICVQCYADGRYYRKETYEDGPSDLVHASGHHGNAAFDECDCDEGPCIGCFVVVDGGSEKGRCKGCSCTCHHKFTPRTRLFNLSYLERLVEDSTRFAPNEVPFAVETLARLQKEPLPAAAASEKEQAASVPQAVDDASGGQILDHYPFPAPPSCDASTATHGRIPEKQNDDDDDHTMLTGTNEVVVPPTVSVVSSNDKNGVASSTKNVTDAVTKTPSVSSSSSASAQSTNQPAAKSATSQTAAAAAVAVPPIQTTTSTTSNSTTLSVVERAKQQPGPRKTPEMMQPAVEPSSTKVNSSSSINNSNNRRAPTTTTKDHAGGNDGTSSANGSPKPAASSSSPPHNASAANIVLPAAVMASSNDDDDNKNVSASAPIQDAPSNSAAAATAAAATTKIVPPHLAIRVATKSSLEPMPKRLKTVSRKSVSTPAQLRPVAAVAPQVAIATKEPAVNDVAVATTAETAVSTTTTTGDKNCVYSGPVPDNDVPDHDLTGWRKEIYKRDTNAKRRDQYWFTPQQNIRLRSRVEISRYFRALGECDGDEAKAAERAAGKKH